VPLRSPHDDDPFRLVGTHVGGRYRIDAPVAEGGFGLVYRGYQEALSRPVAVKVLKVPPQLSRDSRRLFEQTFADEAKTIARLKHPHIVEVYDFGVEKGLMSSLPWMALEWLDGQTLEQSLLSHRGRTPLVAREALALMRPILATIAFAHRERVAHRDLKPGNIMLVDRGAAQPVPKVLDFGIAKLMRPDEMVALTNPAATSGVPVFSPAYAAPEQMSRGKTGPWTDVHALGLILTELLTNAAPYEVAEDQLFEAVVADDRPTPASKGIDAGAWEPVLARALARRPRDRYQHAAELLAALEATVAGAPHTVRDVPRPAPAPPATGSGPPTVRMPPAGVGPTLRIPGPRSTAVRTAALVAAAVVGGGASGAALFAIARPVPTPAARVATGTPSARAASAPAVVPLPADAGTSTSRD
jgi:serine/threonine protein kinase